MQPVLAIVKELARKKSNRFCFDCQVGYRVQVGSPRKCSPCGFVLTCSNTRLIDTWGAEQRQFDTWNFHMYLVCR